MNQYGIGHGDFPRRFHHEIMPEGRPGHHEIMPRDDQGDWKGRGKLSLVALGRKITLFDLEMAL